MSDRCKSTRELIYGRGANDIAVLALGSPRASTRPIARVTLRSFFYTDALRP
jgi:hypothetical protein